MTSLTRRGLVVLGIGVGSGIVAVLYGTQAVGALTTGLGAVLAVSYWQVRRADRPSLTREPLPPRVAGTTQQVTLTIDTVPTLLLTVSDPIDTAYRPGLAGVTATNNHNRAVPPDGTVTYALSMERRGVYRLGPTEVSLQDPFGLVARQFRLQNVSEVLVYPAAIPLSGRLRTDLANQYGHASPTQRDVFDGLREYDPADPLRDINWKVSAGQPDETLIVTEYTGADRGRRELWIGVETTAPADVDAIASATVSIAQHLLAVGYQVGLQTPDSRITPGRGPHHRRQLNETLARLAETTTTTTTATEITIRPDRQGETPVEIALEHRTYQFETTTRSTEVTP